MKQMPLLDLCFCPISPFPRQVRDRDVIKAFIKIVLLLLFLQNQMSAQVDWSLTANFTSTENGKTGLADPLVRDIQMEVIKTLSRGFSYKMVAAELDIGIETVRTYVKRIYEKLHVHSVAEAIAKAFLKDR